MVQLLSGFRKEDRVTVQVRMASSEFPVLPRLSCDLAVSTVPFADAVAGCHLMGI